MGEEFTHRPHNLRIPQRFITDHNAEGKAIFSSKIDETAPMKQMSKDVRFALMYATNEFPVDLSNNKDLQTYESYLNNLPGLVANGGTILRQVDMPPGSLSPMHRTVSLDYGVVLEGEVELVLDSGETKLLKRGDIAIQRGTMHAWRNSTSEWARMLYVLQESKPIETDGKTLGEDYGDPNDVLSQVARSS